VIVGLLILVELLSITVEISYNTIGSDVSVLIYVVLTTPHCLICME